MPKHTPEKRRLNELNKGKKQASKRKKKARRNRATFA